LEKVSLNSCSSYDDPALKDKILKSLIDIDFDPQVFNGMRIGIKPNLLIPSAPERSIITHPVFFQNVVQIIKDYNGIPVIVENPAVHGLSTLLKKTPYGEIVQALNVEVPEMKETQLIPYDDAIQFKRIEISKAFFDVDMIVNLPKLKTHGLTVITGALKNLFGVIPGLKKSRMHLKAPSQEDFSSFMMDLYGALLYGFEPAKSILHIMDGIVGMEGEGPGLSGTPKPIGVIISSRDPLAVDWVATQIINISPEDVPTLSVGFKRDFCISSPDDVKVIGDDPEKLKLTNFQVSKNSFFSNAVRWPFTSSLFKQWLVEKPVPQDEKCTLCYQCMLICPAKAITNANNKEKTPNYDYDKCIRCFCCMEICPEAAIKTQKGWLQWLMRY